MTKSTGKKYKVNDQVTFRHVAKGNKLMSGTIIEISQTHGYLIKDHLRNRIYPGVYVDNPKALGKIVGKIK